MEMMSDDGSVLTCVEPADFRQVEDEVHHEEEVDEVMEEEEVDEVMEVEGEKSGDHQFGATSGPDEASKEMLMANTQGLMHNMVNNMNLQTEGEMLPIESCDAGGDARSRKKSSADEGDVVEAKYVAAQEEMKGKVSSTKYRVPEVIKMSMEGSPSLGQFKSIDGSDVAAETSGRGSRRAFGGEVKGGLKRTTGGEAKGGSANKKRRLSKSVEGVSDLAVPKKSGVKAAKTSQSVEDTEVGIRTGKQPLSSVAVGGSAKKQPNVERPTVKGVGSSRHASEGKARKVGRPRSKFYPPTNQILGETPLGDQTR